MAVNLHFLFVTSPSLSSNSMSDCHQDPHDNGTALFHNQDLLSSDETNHVIAENYNSQEKILDALEEMASSVLPGRSSQTKKPPSAYGWD